MIEIANDDMIQKISFVGSEAKLHANYTDKNI